MEPRLPQGSCHFEDRTGFGLSEMLTEKRWNDWKRARHEGWLLARVQHLVDRLYTEGRPGQVFSCVVPPFSLDLFILMAPSDRDLAWEPIDDRWSWFMVDFPPESESHAT